ncbi:la-related protein 4B isoform X5 [Neopsephotus bourkii]|uniref:la-related protein 4B isoform X5 n=1 Tax=Neopsephotus bourkii TaxID=309878 RepID=UPI002AA53ED3|nr:la-related protein 4B isoform X5 [Neopsephotus bourkii]
MGCCFSKELSNNTNEEKTSLLEKSAEEEAPKSRISKTLSSILRTVKSQDLHTGGRTANGAAAVVGIEHIHNDDCRESNSKFGVWDRKAKYLSYESMENTPCDSSRRTYGGPFSFFNSFSHLLKVSGTYGNLQKTEEMKDTVIQKEASKKSNSAKGQHMNYVESINSNINNGNVAAEEHCLFDHICTSHVPDMVDKGLQGEISLNRNFQGDYAVTCDYSRQNETTVNVKDCKSDCLQKVSASDREMSPTFPYLDVDNRQNTKDREFYSICVVDAEDLKGTEEVPATVHEETAAGIDNSAVTDEGMCSMARPLDSGGEFPMQQSTHVEAKFNSQKELFEYKKLDRSSIKEKEAKEYCSINIQSSYDNLLANRSQVHGLNTDSTVKDGLIVKVCDEVNPENEQEEIHTGGDSISCNESFHRACDSVKFVCAAEGDRCTPNSENMKHGDCTSSVSLNTGVCNSGKNKESLVSEMVPFGLSRHSSSVVREINTKEVADNMRGNFKLSLELDETDKDAFLVSQHVEKLEEDYFLKPENEVNANVEKKTFQRTFGDDHMLASASSENHSVLEEYLEDKEKCTGTVLRSSEASSMMEICENLEESSDFQTQIKGCTENRTSTEAANHSGMEEDVSVSITELKGNLLEEAGSLSRVQSWVSDGTLTSCELHNTGTDEMFLKKNNLESQISQESPGNKGKLCKYSNSDSKTSVSSMSVEHEGMNKMNMNCRQDEQQDTYSFHTVENQWNVGTDLGKIVGDVVESTKETKFEARLNETIDNKAKNVKQNLDANVIDCDKTILNCNKGLTHDEDNYSKSTVPSSLDNFMYKSVKLIDDTKNQEDAGNLLHKAHNSLPSLCQNACCHVCDKPEETELCHCVNPEPEVGNTQVPVGPFTEVESENNEKSVCDVNECNLQHSEVEQCVNICSKEEDLTGFSTSTGNTEAFTTGNLEQLELKTTELKSTSYIINAQMNDLTTSWEQMQSDHKIFSNKELGVFVDPEQVDKYAATPSYEIHRASPGASGFQQGSELCVLGLMKDTPSDQDHSYELDRQNPHIEIWSHFISLQTGSADWTNRLFSDTVIGSNGEYLMGFLCNNAVSNNTVKNDRPCIVNENFQNEPEDLRGASYAVGRYPYQLLAPENVATWGWQDNDEFESTKVSELNPNAKVWGNHMLHLEASGATDGSVSKTWEEIPDQPPDSCKEELDASSDGDKKHHNAVLTELQEPSPVVSISDQTDMNPLALDHSEYESMHETTQTGVDIIFIRTDPRKDKTVGGN